jgi:hypothetical protein
LVAVRESETAARISYAAFLCPDATPKTDQGCFIFGRRYPRFSFGPHGKRNCTLQPGALGGHFTVRMSVQFFSWCAKKGAGPPDRRVLRRHALSRKVNLTESACQACWK